MEEFLGEHITLSFTKCFRLSEQLAGKLGRIWQKEIIGVNNDCVVEEMTPESVVEFLARQRTQDILCLGRRTSSAHGALLSDTLNILEERYPQKFNKKRSTPAYTMRIAVHLRQVSTLQYLRLLTAARAWNDQSV